ncbi:MAG TPA: single-stranded-DNA-specific exonuclease RecJ [bacterium]|nr:single-stranded-DNA-specific exonuclease RecJ [bacterium]
MEDPKALQRRSLSDRTWEEPPALPGEAELRALRDGLGITEGFARLLAARGLHDVDEARTYLHPEAARLHDPLLMLGMREAVLRIVKAIENYEKVLVFGDYDMDGTAGASIFYGYLKRLGARVNYFIPKRLADGYGFTESSLQKIAEWKADLVITTDHGSTDLEAPERLRRLGIDLIISDHHQLGAGKPDAVALVNPQQPGCPYPFKGLAAAGVAYKLICALDQHLTEQHFWSVRGICHTSPDYFLDLVALATVADMAPLVGENRILVKLGLDILNTRLRPGLSGLVKECRIRGTITPSVIAFKIAPKINALGRVGDPRMGMQLLLSHSYTEARRLARHLVDVNRERQEIERIVYADASVQMEALTDHPALILVGDRWHPGVIGSIATRIAFESRRPTLVLSHQEAPEVIGSARSSENYNVLGVLEACQQLLERFGGHPSAAGMMLHQMNLHAFTSFFRDAAERDAPRACGGSKDHVRIETWIEAEDLTRQFLDEIAQMSPFGYGNREPVVGVRGFTVRDPAVVNSRHLRFSLACEGGAGVDAFAWDRSGWAVQPSARYDVAFMPQDASGDGSRPQIRVLDLIYAD